VRVPSWWRFPIIGSFGGDGGEVLLVIAELKFCLHLDNKRLMTVRKKKMIKVAIPRKNQAEEFSCRKVDIVYCVSFLKFYI